MELVMELNRLAGSTGLTEVQAANKWAGRTGLELPQAINLACGTTDLEVRTALNKKAGTTGLPTQLAAARIGRRAVLDGSSGCYLSTPDKAAYAMSGTLRFVCRLRWADYTPAAITGVMAQYNTTGNQRGWLIQIITDGRLQFIRSTDGQTGTAVTGTSTAPSLTDDTIYWLGIEYVTGSGALTFYKAADAPSVPSIWSAWTQISTTSITSGAPFDSTAALTIGAFNAGTSNMATGNFYNAVVYDDGVSVATFDATDAVVGSTSIVSAATGETWTVNGTAVIQ